MKQKTNNLKLVTIILTVIFSLVTGLLSRRIKVLDPHAQPRFTPNVTHVDVNTSQDSKLELLVQKADRKVGFWFESQYLS